MELESLASRAKKVAISHKKKEYIDKLKTCSMGGLTEGSMFLGHPVRFSSRMAMCNTCYSNKVVTCGCGRPDHRRMPEPDMQIYDVVNDKYYLSQGCMDKSNGLNRSQLNAWGRE